MSNVIDFETRLNVHRGSMIDVDRPNYAVFIQWTDTGFNWEIDNGDDNPAVIPEERVAADLAAIALQLRPPPRTFLERLKALFIGDDQ